MKGLDNAIIDNILYNSYNNQKMSNSTQMKAAALITDAAKAAPLC